MNGKMILLLAGVGVGGFLIYKKMFGQGAVAGNTVTPYANPQLLAQPSLAYPYKANQSPRNDNQSEPWYGGSRAFNTQTANQTMIDAQNFQVNASYVKGFADITSSLGDIWGNLGVSDWFNDDSGDFMEDSVSDFAGDSFSWDSLDMWA